MAGKIGALLFGGVFAAFGIGFFIFMVLPTLSLAFQVQSWIAADATIEEVELVTHHGDDGQTYNIRGHYRYFWQGRHYRGDRFALMTSSDNIGSFYQDLYHQLQQAQANQTSVTIWVNPKNPQQSLVNKELRWGMLAFVTIFVVVFGGVGLTIIIFTFKHKPAAPLTELPLSDNPQSLLNNRPWLQNKLWQNATILSNAKSQLVAYWGFTLFWNAVSTPILFIVPQELNNGKYAVLLALLFPLVGAGLLWKSITDTARWRRYGRTPLTMDPFPGAIGGDIGGYVKINFPHDPNLRFKIIVSCLHSYMSGSGKNRSRKESVIWQKDGLAETQNIEGKTQVLFRFRVPPDLPQADITRKGRYHLWRLTLQCDRLGKKFNRNFDIPVFATAENSTQYIPLSSEHEALAEQAQADLEAYIRINHNNQGLELFMPAGKRITAPLVFTITGLIFSIVGTAIYMANSPGFLAFTFTTLGLLFLLGGTYFMGLSLRSFLNTDGIYCTACLFGVIIRKQFYPRESIRELNLQKTMSSNNGKQQIDYYAIYAITHTKKKITLAHRLKGKREGELLLESIKVLSGYT